MSRSPSNPFGKGQAPRPSAAAAKAANEGYATFQARLARIAAAATQAGRTELADELTDLGLRVADHEITLEEGMAELRGHEGAIRAMLKR